MKKILLTITAVILLQNALAQNIPTHFSLAEAIDFGLQNNYNAINAKRDITIAQKKKWETTTMGLPQINAKIDYQNWLKQQVQLIPAEFFGGKKGEFAEVSFGTSQNVNASATLSQLIFDGSYLVGLQSAKVYLQISKNAKEKTEIEIKKSIINAYGNVLLSEKSMAIIEKNIASLQKTLNETKEIYKNGLTEQENVEQLKITLSEVKSQYSKAKKLHQIAEKMLNITLGISLDKKITLTDNLDKLAKENINFKLLQSKTDIQNHIDFKIAKNQEKANELLVKLEQSKALPSLVGFVNYNYTGNANEFSFLKKEQKWFNSSLLGVSLNIPIFSSLKRSSKTQQAKIELEKTKTNLIQIQEQLKLKIETAKTNYQYSIEEYENSKQNLALAERIEKKQQTKYFEGISTSFDLANAQRQLYKMQQNYLQAMLNVINKKTELETALNKTYIK